MMARMTQMTHSIDIPHRRRRFRIRITEDGALELWLDGCLRKRCAPSPGDPLGPLYVWTNIELDWEEHHYIEARYHRRTGTLAVAVNGACVLERVLECG